MTASAANTAAAAAAAAAVDTFDGFSGWLEKRAERGLQSYQRRFFVVSLSDQSFSYYKQPDCLFPIHFVPLSDILLVQLLADQKKGCRFDVVTSHRVMQLMADSPKAAADWVMAISRSLNTTRERQVEKTNNRHSRQPEPRTPTILKPFLFSHILPPPPPPPQPQPQQPGRPIGVSGVSGLRAAFLALNFSVSTLNQPDFFHDLLDDFRTDDDILAFLMDVLLSPDTNDNAARAILQAREIAARAKEGQLGAASRLHTSNGSKQDDERGGGGGGEKEGNRSKVAGGGGGGGGKLGGILPPSADGDKEEELSQLSTNGQADGRLPRTHSRQATATITTTSRPRTSPRNPPRLIRSRSNLCLDLVHLSYPITVPQPSPRYDTDVGVVSPAGRLRASLPYFARYDLFRASANRSRDYAMFDARKKIVSWLHSDTAIRILADQRLMNQRLALPLLFALLQSRHHEDADDDEAGGGSMMFGKGAGGGGKARRSPSYDSDQNSTSSLANIFKQGNFLITGQSSQPSSPASPAIPLTPTTSVAHSSPSPGSPFRSHLTVSSHPVDPVTSYQDRDTGVEASVSGGGNGAAKTRLSPYNTPASAAAPPPRFAASNGRALNFATPTPSPSKQMSTSNLRDLSAAEFPYPTASHSMPSGNRYATVRLPSPHTAASASAANSVAFGARGGAARRPSLPASHSLSANHWRREYSSNCSQCRAAAQQLCELVSAQFRTTAPSSSLSIAHVNALLSTLVTPVDSLAAIDNIDSEANNVFNKPVVNAGVWLTLFTLLDGASYRVKKHALKDITGVLVAANVGSVNCESVLQVPRWQSFVLPLLFPRPLRNPSAPPSITPSYTHNNNKTASRNAARRSSSSTSSQPSSTALYERSLREKVDQYAQNVMGVLHFHAFMTRSADEFAVIFKHSFLLAMRESKGGVRVPRSMLQVTLQRLISKLKAKALELDERWSSIDYLIAFIKAFVMGLPLNTPQSQQQQSSYNNTNNTHPQLNGSHHSHRESLFQSAASLLSSHHTTSQPRERPPTGAATTVLDFGFLRPPGVWKRGLLEDRDLIERTLQLMRRCRVYQDVDLSTFSSSKQLQVKEQIEHGSANNFSTQTVSAALHTAASSAGNSPSTLGSSGRHGTHKRQMSTAASQLSLMSSQSASSSSLASASSSSQPSKPDLFHPLNRFKLNATSEDLAISYLSWSAVDRSSFLCVQKEVGWCKDVVVFVSVVWNRLGELSDEQIGQLRSAFASGADKREKVFGNVKSVAELRKRR